MEHYLVRALPVSPCPTSRMPRTSRLARYWLTHHPPHLPAASARARTHTHVILWHAPGTALPCPRPARWDAGCQCLARAASSIFQEIEAAEEKDEVQTGTGVRKMYNTDFNEIPTMVGIKEFDAEGLHAATSAQVQTPLLKATP